jgi:hypothetical protein
MPLPRSVVVAALAAVVSLSYALPAGAGEIDPDAAFTVTVAKAVDGAAADGPFDFSLDCASDEGVGEASFVSIDDPTFPGFESEDRVEFELDGGEEASFEVYVEFSRLTVITCRALEVGAPEGTVDTTTTCAADDLVVCDDPEEGEIGQGGAGEASLSWVDVDEADAFGEDVGAVTFEFTNVIEAAPTTATPTTAATTATTAAAAPAAATAATPRFTG